MKKILILNLAGLLAGLAFGAEGYVAKSASGNNVVGKYD